MRDQGGPPILADMGNLHKLEHRLSGPWLRDKFGDRYYGFRWQFADDAEYVLGDNDAPERMLEGGMKCLQLVRVARVSNRWSIGAQ